MYKKYRVQTTDSAHDYPVAKNVLNGEFTAEKPGQKWVSDLDLRQRLCIWVHLYSYRRRLAVLANSAGFSGPESNRLGGPQMRCDLRSMSDTLKAIETSMAAWRMAFKKRSIAGELLFH
jgi:hypothetical protein